MSHLVIGSKVLGYMKYLIRSVKRAAGVVGIFAEENWDVKRVNSLYNMVSGRFNFKINENIYSLIWYWLSGLFFKEGFILLDN